jgi:ABC-type branched-subunit amino acid transport system ATPase component
MGGSGCGKSQLIKMVAGLTKPQSGKIFMYGKEYDNKTTVPMTFQQPSCFEWLTVLDNVALPLKLQGVGKEERYEKARRRSAASNDANQRVFLDRVRSEQTKLNNEMNLQYQAYSQVAAQLRLAEAKVQEETPAFTTLQSATVPVQKSGPRRTQMCLIFVFLAFLGTTAWILYKEDDLKPLLGLS